MAVQNNNLLLIDLTNGNPKKGLSRTIATTDEINLTPQSVSMSTSQALNLATGGSVADLQAPTVRIGTESTGSYANTSVTIGTSTSSVYLYGSSYTLTPGSGIGVTAENATASVINPGELVVESASGIPVSAGATPYVKLSDANAATLSERNFLGVALDAIAVGSTGRISTVPGSIAIVAFDPGGLPSPGQRSLPVYVSTTPGLASMSTPTSGRVFQIGYLMNVSAVSGNNFYVQLSPQIIADIP